MMEDKPIAGNAVIVHGGENRSKSSVRRIAGMAWKPRSASVEIVIQSGMTNFLSIARRPQYKILMRTAKGAPQTDSKFLVRNSLGERVKSAADPKMKVRVAMVRPIIVRY